MLLDDLHWADGPTLEQLLHLAFAISDSARDEPMRLLAVAALRPPESDDALGRCLKRLEREPIAESVRIAELGEAETAT